MKNFTRLFQFTLLALASMLSTGCGEDDELDTDGTQPTVRVHFFNARKIAEIEAITLVLNGQMIMLADQIAALQTEIDNEEDQATKDILNAEKEVLQEERDLLEEDISDYADTVSTINEGLVLIDLVSGAGTENTIDFGEDSLGSFSFPLNPNEDTTTFAVTIAGQTNTFSLAYTNIITKELNKIIRESTDLWISGTNYDSIKMYCSDSLYCTLASTSDLSLCNQDSLKCTNNEASLDIYF